jgi:hypothetical protein
LQRFPLLPVGFRSLRHCQACGRLNFDKEGFPNTTEFWGQPLAFAPSIGNVQGEPADCGPVD